MKTSLITKLISLVAMGSVVVACDTTSKTYFETPIPQEVKQFKSADAQTRGESVKYDPRVDILFVIDDSASMKVHQANLKRNINQFVKSIDRTKVIDFHIGVTTVYDSTRYGSIVRKECGGKINFEENGALRPLKGLAAPIEERFVTRREGYLGVLEATLDVGVIDFVNPDAKNPNVCATGPEVEEIFSPIIESFNGENFSGANKGFWRESTLKVVILVTDALDSSPNLTASQVAKELYIQSGSTQDDNKFRVYAVTMVPGSKVTNKGIVSGTSCKLDPAFKVNGAWPAKVPNHSIADLVNMTSGKMLSICQKDYGVELAKVGEEIRVATLKNIVYDLPFLPDQTQGRQLQVWFKKNDQGSLFLKEGQDWYYNAQKNQVVVYGMNLDWDNNPDAYIDLDYVPVDPNNPDNKVIQK